MNTDAEDAGGWFRRRRRSLPDRAAFLVAGSTKVTYGDVDRYADRFGAFAADQGIAANGTILILSKDPVVVGNTIVAAFRSGRAICVLEPTISERELQFALVQIAPSLVLADSTTIERCGLAASTQWRTIQLDRTDRSPKLADRLLGRSKTGPRQDWHSVLADYEGRQVDHPELGGGEIVMLIYTSGSSGQPKAVELTLAAVLSHLEAFSMELDLDGSRFHNVLPLSHVDGYLAPVLAYFRGATWVRPCDFSVVEIPEILDSVYRDQATHMFVVPTMLALFERLGSGMEDAFETEQFQTVISSAGPLAADLWGRFEQNFKTHICNSYGLTETVTSSIVSGPPEGTTRRIGTIGKPLAGCIVRLVDDSGHLVERGEVGEIELGGPHLFTRYRGDQARTDAALRDGRFLTGDLAVQSPDGFFELKGRKSSVIVSGGRNVSPEEIDEVIGQLAGVSQVGTVGVEDPIWGQRVESAVVTLGSITVEEILGHCRDQLSPFKVPHRVTICHSLPLTTSAKLDTKALVRQLGQAAEVTVQGEAVDDVVLTLAAKVFGVARGRLTLSSNMESVDGWDSLGHLDFVTEVEDVFRFRMTNTEILSIRNLADVVEIVEQRASR